MTHSGLQCVEAANSGLARSLGVTKKLDMTPFMISRPPPPREDRAQLAYHWEVTTHASPRWVPLSAITPQPTPLATENNNFDCAWLSWLVVCGKLHHVLDAFSFHGRSILAGLLQRARISLLCPLDLGMVIVIRIYIL